MAILIRKSGELTVALCAVEADRQPEDIYLEDAAHEALSAKFEQDFISMGFMAPRGIHPMWAEMEKHKVRDAEQDLIDWVSTTRPAPEPKCFECGDSGEVFGHADDCDNDSCALNGDIDSCLGKVEPCGCFPAPEKGPEANERGDCDDLPRNHLVDLDHARLALFDAIGKIKIGNPTDDKLILDNLREAGFWICHLDQAPDHANCAVGERLRECPFCGNPLTMRGGVNAYGRCDTKDCWMHERGIAVPLAAKDQVDAWNTRAALAPMPNPAGIRADERARVVASTIILISQDGSAGCETHGLFSSFQDALAHAVKDGADSSAGWQFSSPDRGCFLDGGVFWTVSREPVRGALNPSAGASDGTA